LSILNRQLSVIKFVENWRTTYPREWTGAVFESAVPFTFNETVVIDIVRLKRRVFNSLRFAFSVIVTDSLLYVYLKLRITLLSETSNRNKEYYKKRNR